MTETLQEPQSISGERFGVPRGDPDPDRSMDALRFVSLSVINLMFSIEDHNGIKMPKHGPEIRTLKQPALWVDSLRGASGRARPCQ